MSSSQCRELAQGLRDPGRLADRRLLRTWLDGLTNVEECIADGLYQSSAIEDWVTFEHYLLAAFHRPSRAYTQVLCTVLGKHDSDINFEDVITVLAEIRDPMAVGCLKDALRWEPEWDEYRNLAVKCIWALAAIGTPSAMDSVREAANSDVIEVRDAALRLLKDGSK